MLCFLLVLNRKNFLRIYKLIHGVGLRTLRELFKKIHPTWSNQPKNAAGLDRGEMVLDSHEENKFKTGNIEDWDFSLIAKVLMFSEKCRLKISKEHWKTLKKVQKHRNKIGHSPKDRMSTREFESCWRNISADFKTLGANPAEIQDILTGTFVLALVVLVFLVFFVCL